MIRLEQLKLLPKYVFDETYRININTKRKLEKLKKIPRYTKFDFNIFDSQITIIDSLSFYYSYQEIFNERIYSFLSINNQPLIIDIGSNIGLSIIFFKKIYPEARIIAFEADPEIFKTLRSNISQFEFTNVELFNKAVWLTDEGIQYIADKADAGRIFDVDTSSGIEKIVTIPSIRLFDFLKDQHIDFLKMDIEGAEFEVINDCKELLENVDNIFIEYHSFEAQEQKLSELLDILKKSGFRYQVHTNYASKNPFLRQEARNGKDLLLNIFGYRLSR